MATYNNGAVKRYDQRIYLNLNQASPGWNLLTPLQPTVYENTNPDPVIVTLRGYIRASATGTNVSFGLAVVETEGVYVNGGSTAVAYDTPFSGYDSGAWVNYEGPGFKFESNNFGTSAISYRLIMFDVVVPPGWYVQPIYTASVPGTASILGFFDVFTESPA